MSTTEILIEQTGGCGMFQVFHVFSTHLCRMTAVWALNMMSFGNYEPEWACTADPLDGRVSNTSWLSRGDEGNCSRYDKCSKIAYEHTGKTIVTEWDLVCDRDWIPSLMISLQMLGQMIGSFIAGFVGEKFGRKICMYSHVMFLTLTNIAAAFSTSWQMFAAFRLLIGVGIGGITSMCFIYTMEYLNPKWRGIVGGLPINNSGLVIFSLVVYLEQDWRLIQITCGGATLIAMLTFLWISESMRWLTVHDKTNEAKAIVAKIARYNKCQLPDLSIVDITAEKEKVNPNPCNYTFLDLFRPGFRSITVKLASLWLFEVTSYYFLSFSVKSLPGNFYRNFFILSASEIPAVLLIGPSVNRLGRTKSGAVYFTVSGAACLASGFVSMFASSDYNFLLVLFAMVGKGLLAGGRSVARLCTSELTPTCIRGVGYSFNMLFSRFGAIVAPFLVSGNSLHFGVTLIVQSVFLFASGIIFMTLPESKDQSMTDLFERDVKTPSKYETFTDHKELKFEDDIVSNGKKKWGSISTSIDSEKHLLLSGNKRK